MSNTRPCPLCLFSAAEVRHDKKGAPYIRCRCCGSRAFLHDASGLNGLALLETLIHYVPLSDLRRFAVSAGEDRTSKLDHAIRALSEPTSTNVTERTSDATQ